MKKFTSQEIKEFVSKPLFDEKVILSKDPSWPKISIVTPSYNQAQFLERTILSVLNQNYPNLEYIIIDGGSTDGSVEIIKKYEKYLAYWVSEKDKGQSDAINKGFKKSTGKILAWLNSDDVYFDKEVLRGVARVFKKYSQVDIIYGDYVIIDRNDLILKVQTFPKFNFNRMLRGCYVGQPSTFFRRKVINNDNLLNTDLKFAMDYEFWLRLSKFYKFMHINKILSGDRNHPDRKIIAQRENMVKESIMVRKQFGQNYGISYYLGRMWDKVSVGLPARVKGAIKILNLYWRNKNSSVFRSNSLILVLFNQLFIKNKDLI